jgi:hypothetical protein
MKSNEVPGADTVPMEMWRKFSTRSEGLEILRKLFSWIKNRKEFPELCKTAVSGFGGRGVSVLASGTQVRRFKPGGSRRIFKS